ncbi:uncharacterized protein BO97DRAFT_473000 [Aspergillus homomorphus CBS 101889]|uniref:N-acetyltransferase domain-containing protein n=1 Tax=Aspergillus homomorphus (strain CBS 101889) TaxID=1450537 RepID=A0A395HKM1_ASPHC|nr:hypothetical protein BO97DRAFT_473000 [Aspergillus homomorphus CBS 101889]RAL08491.1 hypothetical protein BO97DRAFT_473000 [Aspergillus homomorphus CBS 101889]
MSNEQTSKAHSNQNAVRVEPITAAEDFDRFFEITALAFGHQVKDGVWCAMNPGWDTPEGQKSGSSRLAARWSSTTTDRYSRPNAIFLKAVVPSQGATEGDEEIAGVAVWVQASQLEGHGDAPATDIGSTMDLEALFPGNPAEQRYLRQVDLSLRRRRIEFVREIATTSSPAVMVLDLCAVDPAFQRRGVATKLVEWGLQEARQRGGIEAILEASSMGRHVYRKLGFEQDGGEFRYDVDDEFRDRERPSNVFMRTGRPAM